MNLLFIARPLCLVWDILYRNPKLALAICLKGSKFNKLVILCDNLEGISFLAVPKRCQPLSFPIVMLFSKS